MLTKNISEVKDDVVTRLGDKKHEENMRKGIRNVWPDEAARNSFIRFWAYAADGVAKNLVMKILHEDYRADIPELIDNAVADNKIVIENFLILIQ